VRAAYLPAWFFELIGPFNCPFGFRPGGCTPCARYGSVKSRSKEQGGGDADHGDRFDIRVICHLSGYHEATNHAEQEIRRHGGDGLRTLRICVFGHGPLHGLQAEDRAPGAQRESAGEGEKAFHGAPFAEFFSVAGSVVRSNGAQFASLIRIALTLSK